MAEQLTFDLPVRPALGREAFFVSPANATALALLDGWRDWPLGKLVLVGPAGAGKTHLAHVWAAETDARIVPASDVTEASVPTLAEAPALAIEDADGGALDERALFHLHNLLAEAKRPLLLTAQRAPRDWGLALPDLASRIEAAGRAELAPPDDALLQAVLVKLFEDRQIAVPPALLPYLTARMDRSFAAARALVVALDAAALAEGRAITRPLAAQVLDKLGEADA
ncbi:MAG: DnaA/Hda family protein [Pseudomonadota bacterium]